MTADVYAIAVDTGLLAADGVLADSSISAEIRRELAGPVAAVHAAVMANWVQAATARSCLSCPADSIQPGGGDVVQVSFGKPCNADVASRNAIERAVRRTSPQPFAGFEQALQRRISLVFTYNGH